MKTNNSRKQGVALIAIMGMTAMVLVLITVFIMVSVVDARMNLGKLQSEKAYQAMEALGDEALLNYIRSRLVSNPYPEWTGDCLQIPDFECKMDLNLDESGGVVEIWGRVKNKVRKMEIEVEVLEDESVNVISRREVL